MVLSVNGVMNHLYLNSAVDGQTLHSAVDGQTLHMGIVAIYCSCDCTTYGYLAYMGYLSHYYVRANALHTAHQLVMHRVSHLIG